MYNDYVKKCEFGNYCFLFSSNKPMNKADYLFKINDKVIHHSCFKIHKARGNLHLLD